jgi:multimeric flavodoxin WrbA
MSKKIVGLVGSYRKGGIVDTLVTEVLNSAQEQGAVVEKIYLIDQHIEFCTNCRACTQTPGEEPGVCPLQDDMDSLLTRCRQADALVLGAPVNCYNITAITRRFMERLVCTAYWPWGQGGPAVRIKKGAKPAVLITATAMPAFMGRIFTGAMRALRGIAQALEAHPVRFIRAGMIAQTPDARPPAKLLQQARIAGSKLAAD